MPELTSPDDIRRVLESSRTVAVLGAHDDRERPAYYVPDYLAYWGYRVMPVNPKLRGRILWREPAVAHLPSLEAAVDIVDVFRRSDKVPDHVDDILAMKPRPKVVWLQSGVRNDEAARRLVDAGIDVVQDRCMLADHRALGVGRRNRTA